MASNDVNMQDAGPEDASDSEPLMEAVDNAPAAENGDGMQHLDRNSPLLFDK